MACAVSLEPRPGGIGSKLGSRLESWPVPARIVAVFAVAYVAVSLVMLLSGLVVDEFIVGGWIGGLDHDMTHWMADHRNGVLNAITAVMSDLADTLTVVGLSVGAGLVLLALRCWRQAVVLLVALPLELFVFLSVTFIVARPRPTVVPLDSLPVTPSYPSGHVAAAIALYVSVAFILGSLTSFRWAKCPAFIIAVVLALGVGISRVYRGLHHPTDIIGGAVLGTFAVVVAVAAARLVPDDLDDIDDLDDSRAPLPVIGGPR